MSGLLLPERSLWEALRFVERVSCGCCIVPLVDAVFYSKESLDLLESPNNWIGSVGGKVTVPWSAGVSQVESQLHLAGHLGLPFAVVDLPSVEDVVVAADCILEHCKKYAATKVVIAPEVSDESSWRSYRCLIEALNADSGRSSWHSAADICQKSGVHDMLSVMLPCCDDQDVFPSWLGERILYVKVSPWKRLVYIDRVIQVGANVLIDISTEVLESSELIAAIDDRREEAATEFHRLRPFPESISQYEDVLQIPLQPLADHLANPVYAVFESDSAKYESYEVAVENFLGDAGFHSAHLVVLGAGRGPLVSCALRAARSRGVTVKISAIEKNPFAVKFLKLKLEFDSLWLEAASRGDTIDIILGDGRSVASDLAKSAVEGLSPPVRVVISELLGSVGDNELSPECVDGFLYAYASVVGNKGPLPISIPKSYTSFFSPVFSTTLVEQVRGIVLRGGILGNNDHMSPFHTCYVVQPLRAHILSSSRQCFRFEHGNIQLEKLAERGDAHDRFAVLSFESNSVGVVHGVLGYFEAELYTCRSGLNIRISTRPETRTPGMYSWFPAFFPVLPATGGVLKVGAGDAIKFSLARRHTSEGVWFEWRIETRERSSKMMNDGGSFNIIGL